MTVLSPGRSPKFCRKSAAMYRYRALPPCGTTCDSQISTPLRIRHQYTQSDNPHETLSLSYLILQRFQFGSNISRYRLWCVETYRSSLIPKLIVFIYLDDFFAHVRFLLMKSSQLKSCKIQLDEIY